jgi:hypothetical protein
VSNNCSNNTCSICLEQNDETSIKISCNHCYHSKCIKIWFNKSKFCPLCRRQSFIIVSYKDSLIIISRNIKLWVKEIKNKNRKRYILKLVNKNYYKYKKENYKKHIENYSKSHKRRSIGNYH